jgi:N-acetylmuramoyl-L-alanine amidase
LAWPIARGLLLIALAYLPAATATPASPAEASQSESPASPAPVRAAPTRPPHVWSFIKLGSVDYVALAEIAKRYRLKAAWTKPGLERTLSDARGVRLRFEASQRDAYLDGVRIFFGAPVLPHKKELWVSKLDVIKTLAPLLGPEDQIALLPGPPRLIVIDPGHGGTDPGMQNPKLKLNEKEMTLDVAWRLRKILEMRGYRVLMTREKDTRFSNSPTIDLPLRADFANKAGADLFLSIHFNAVDARNAQRVTGSETYVLTPQFMVSTQPESNKAMQAEQNPGNRHDPANALLGYQLHRRLVTDLKTSDRGYKRYRYAVLRTLTCPGALIEAAYLSHDTEAARVGTPAFRQQIADAIAEGVQDYAAALAALRPTPASDK